MGRSSRDGVEPARPSRARGDPLAQEERASGCATATGRRPRPPRSPRPVGETTGKWRNPRSNISSSTSPARRSAVGGVRRRNDIAAETGSSPVRPPATTLVRRSRSVRMPSPPSPRSTTTAVAGRRAHQLGGVADRGLGARRRRARRAPGCPPADRRCCAPARGPAVQLDRLSSSDRATKRTPAGAAEQDRSGLVGGDAVAERVLRRPGAERGRQPRQHRPVAEHLALRQHVEHPAARGQLDGARCGSTRRCWTALGALRRRRCRRRGGTRARADAATRSTSSAASPSNGGCARRKRAACRASSGVIPSSVVRPVRRARRRLRRALITALHLQRSRDPGFDALGAPRARRATSSPGPGSSTACR